LNDDNLILVMSIIISFDASNPIRDIKKPEKWRNNSINHENIVNTNSQSIYQLINDDDNELLSPQRFPDLREISKLVTVVLKNWAHAVLMA
jgi:hypothetical protein